MSSLGGKTAKDLNWTFHNEITVTNIQEPCSETSTEPAKFAHQSSESIKESSKKKIHKAQNRSKPTLALDESDDKLKESHSIELTKIFEEAEAIFKAIRQKLNNLTLDRKGPKTKSSSTDKNRDASTVSVDHTPNSFGQGGKAGKSSYTINVGQVENLYKSSKRNYFHSKYSNQRAYVDLHGLPSDQAIERLDEALIGWVDTAMKGEYPWVIPVDIICGGGNQILSETVKTWIKSKTNVSNARKCL